MSDPRKGSEGGPAREPRRKPHDELGHDGLYHGVGTGRGQPGAPSRADAGELEQLIERVVRAQPSLRAPASLQGRVFAQIAAQPWWRRGFSHWPMPARAAFLVASLGFIKLALAGFMSVVDFVHSSDVAGVTALHRTGEAFSTTVSLGETVFHAIPTTWLYAGAAVGFTLYAVLFGLGTFAYRTLYVQK